MNQRDKTILIKIADYCLEIKDTHDYFSHDKELFTNEKNGFIYRNSITMPILQIGELSKTLSVEFLNKYTKIPWKMIMRMRDLVAITTEVLIMKLYGIHQYQIFLNYIGGLRKY